MEARGNWSGNCGNLHDSGTRVLREWRPNAAWITCLVAFKGRKRELFGPGKMSELFFLDEATAYSAGHRPCGECRKTSYFEFKGAYPHSVSSGKMSDIDKAIHRDRVSQTGGKLTFRAELSSLPDGSFVELYGEPHLVLRGKVFRWSFDGYGEGERLESRLVHVLTPASIVEVFRHGLRPEIHRSIPD